MNSIIDSIPTRWKKTKIKYSCYLKARVGWKGMTSDEFRDESYSYLITGTDFKSRSINLKKCYQVDEFRYADDPYIQLREGDLLITKDGTIGKLSFVPSLDKPACLNSGIFLLRTDGTVFNQFLYWVLSSKIFHDFMDLEITGSTIKHLYQESFGNFKYPLPSVYEQRQIATFLNRETAKIDNLISKQKKLIALLKEKRQAVISQAVTKGLDPNVEMKNSGVEWIGRVPTDWIVLKLGFAVENIGDVDHYMPESVEEGIPYVMTGDLQDRASLIDFSQCKQVQPSDFEKLSRKIKTERGDVVMARYATIGTSCYIDISEEFLVSYSCVTIKPKKTLISGLYIHYYLKSYAFFVGAQNLVNSNTQGNLGIADLKRIKIPIPPLPQQEFICDFLENEIKRIDVLIAKSTSSILLLNERRQALMTAAVTGKIDVRDLVTEEEVAALDTEVEQDDFGVESEVEDLDEPEMASEE